CPFPDWPLFRRATNLRQCRKCCIAKDLMKLSHQHHAESPSRETPGLYFELRTRPARSSVASTIFSGPALAADEDRHRSRARESRAGRVDTDRRCAYSIGI